MSLFGWIPLFGNLPSGETGARESAGPPPTHEMERTKQWLALTEDELPERVGQWGLGSMLNPITCQVTPTIYSDPQVIPSMLKKAGLRANLAQFIEHAGWIVLTDRADSNRINIHVACFRDPSQVESHVSSSSSSSPEEVWFSKGPLLVCMHHEGETRQEVFDAIHQTLLNREYPE